ncbi:MAG: hypothetical protein ACOC85_05455, partial [Thermoplasmatota archaeon]
VIAPFSFLSLNWFMEYHMARQAYGVMIWLFFFLFLFLFIEYRESILGLCAGLLLFSIILSHPGMIIILAFNLLGLTIITLLFILNKDKRKYLFPTIYFFIIFLAVLTSIYYLLPSVNAYFTELYEHVIEGGIQGFSFGGPSESSLDYMWTNNLRKVMGIFQSLVGLIGFLYLYHKDTKKALFIGAWFLSCFFWLGYSLTRNGFLIERAFLTAIIPASILISSLFIEFYKNIKWRMLIKVSLLILICTFLLLIPISKNSIDAIERPTSQAFQAGRFIQDNRNDRIWITDTHQGMFRYLEATRESEVRFRARGGPPQERIEGMTFGYRIPATDRTDIPNILFLDYFNNYIQVRYGNETAVKEIKEYEKTVSYNLDKLYDSGGARFYSKNS